MVMFPTTKNEIIRYCIENEEGGWKYTDNKDDAGGATYAGVTYNTYFRYCRDKGFPALDTGSFAEIAQSDTTEHKTELNFRVIGCYEDMFYNPLRLDEMPDYLRCMLFSMAVNIGVKNAAKMLQRVINQEKPSNVDNIAEDGIVGNQTVHNAMLYLVFSMELIRLRVKHRLFYRWQTYYNMLVITNALTWRDYAFNFRKEEPATLRAVNLQGWFNRAVKYIEVER